MTAALARAAAVPGVESVASPYGPAGAAQISRSGTVAFARVTWNRQARLRSPRADAKNLISAAESADGADVHVSLGGPAITNSERAGLGRSLGVGIAAALAILLIVFGGALLAALLPLLTALLALGIGVSVIGLLSHAFGISSVSTQLAILIGLGVGVDYGLFIIGRYRSAVKAGTPQRGRGGPGRADLRPDRPAGRQHGVHRPARPVRPGRQLPVRPVGRRGPGGGPDHGHLAHLPARACSASSARGCCPGGNAGPLAADGPVSAAPAGFWLRWARSSRPAGWSWRWAPWPRWSRSRCRSSACSLGTSDASTDPAGWTTHQAYAALAQGFGPGFNGPLELVGPDRLARRHHRLPHLLATVARTPGCRR